MKNGLTPNEMKVLDNYKFLTDAFIGLPKTTQQLFKDDVHRKSANAYLRKNFQK